jgi:hypothetical protein
MTERYYRQVYVIEVLGNELLIGANLNDINYHIHDGEYSGSVEETVQEEVSREKMIKLLEAQGSDPAFLVSDLRGEDEDWGEI